MLSWSAREYEQHEATQMINTGDGSKKNNNKHQGWGWIKRKYHQDKEMNMSTKSIRLAIFLECSPQGFDSQTQLLANGCQRMPTERFWRWTSSSIWDMYCALVFPSRMIPLNQPKQPFVDIQMHICVNIHAIFDSTPKLIGTSLTQAPVEAHPLSTWNPNHLRATSLMITAFTCCSHHNWCHQAPE